MKNLPFIIFTALTLSISALSADISYCNLSNGIDYKNDSASIEFKGARKGADLRISNLDIQKLQAYVDLKNAVEIDGTSLVLKGVEIANETGLFSECKTVDCYKLSLDDGFLVISKLRGFNDKIQVPDLVSIFCFASLNQDKSVSYLVNSSTGTDETVRIIGSLEYLKNSFEPLMNDFSSEKNLSVSLNKCNLMEFLASATEKCGSDNEKRVYPALLFIEKKTEEKLKKEKTPASDIDAELKENMQGFDTTNEKGENLLDKKADIKGENVPLRNYINQASVKFSSPACPVFWGYAFYLDKPNLSVYKVIAKQGDKLIVQNQDVPGCLRTVLQKDTIAIPKNTVLNNDGSLPNALSTYLYMKENRSDKFMKELYKLFLKGEYRCDSIAAYELADAKSNDGFRTKNDDFKTTNERRLNNAFGDRNSNNSNISDPIKKLVLQRKQLDQEHRELVGDELNKFCGKLTANNMKIWLICPSCNGKGIENRKLCKKCNGLGRMSPENTVNYVISSLKYNN
jgi:hypothetical protein